MAICAWRLAELHGAVAPKQLKHEHHNQGGAPLMFYLPQKVPDGQPGGGNG